MRRPATGDLAGAVADLGVLVPLVAALVLVNGLAPGPVLIMAGLLSVVAGAWFGIPFPVQPLKAMTALAVAQQLPPDVIRAAGLLLGVVLIALRLTGLADRVATAFSKPVIRSLQLAVGALLVVTAVRLVVTPPPLFTSAPAAGWSLLLAAATLAGVTVAARRRWHGATLALLAVGVVATAVATGPELGGPAISGLSLAVPPVAVWGSAFLLLVVPQFPLTYGNAVVGTSSLAREEFPGASRVTPGAVALSCGLGNVASALLGGMPMCHGSSGFTAHVRLGARTAAMNVVLGGTLIVLGVGFAGQVLVLFALLPLWGLAGLLAYAGIRHALLVLDLPARSIGIAVVAAAAGILTGNLAITTGLALAAEWLPRLVVRLRPVPEVPVS